MFSSNKFIDIATEDSIQKSFKNNKQLREKYADKKLWRRKEMGKSTKILFSLSFIVFAIFGKVGWEIQTIKGESLPDIIKQLKSQRPKLPVLVLSMYPFVRQIPTS